MERNRFATQFRSSQSASRPRPWHNVTKEELKAFVGMLMVMGYVNCLELKITSFFHTSASQGNAFGQVSTSFCI